MFPAEVPGVAPVVTEYLAAMQALADELLVICAAALGVEADFFTRHTGARHAHVQRELVPAGVGGRASPRPGQFRIGPHTDFGTVTILDREPGRGGLQVWNADDGWQDAPYDPDALTINIGDLLARWTGDRWMSNRHRVLPPQAEAPGRGPGVAGLFLRGRPRHGGAFAAAADRPPEHLRAGAVGRVPARAPRRHHDGH